MVVVGQPLTLEAHAGGTITDYAWDFDGDGTYETDTGTSAVSSTPYGVASIGTVTYSTVGIRHVSVRVTDDAGQTATAERDVEAVLPPPAGDIGLTINDGDYATNDPHVTITPVWALGVDAVRLSNDGGFGSRAQTIPLATQVPWTLAQTGSDRLPKTVYLRLMTSSILAFRTGLGGTIPPPTQTFTDDIILDETAPTVQSAQLAGAPPSSRALARSAAKHSYRIKLKARDGIVGVCAVAASSTPSAKGAAVVALANCHRRGILAVVKSVTVKASSRPRYVRVQNSAGTWSHWKRLT